MDATASTSNINKELKSLKLDSVKLNVDSKSINQELTDIQKRIESMAKTQNINLGFDKSKLSDGNAELQKMSQYYSRLETQSEAFSKSNKSVWSKVPIKEYTDSLSQTNVELLKMRDYYTALEKESAKLSNINKAQSGVWTSTTVKEQVSQLTRTNDELLKMRDYYKNLEKEAINLGKANQSAFNLNLDKAKLSNNMQSWLNDNSKAASVFGDKIRELQVELQNVDSKADLTKVTKEFQTMQSEAKSLGLVGRTTFDELANSAQKFFSWFMIGGGIASAVRNIKQMVTNVIEINTAMTELKKVTDETDATYTKFLTNAAGRAKELGAAITDVVTASADFARLGYNIDDAATLADVAVLYKNVGDGINNISDASASIISTMKAFRIEAENSISVVDKFNETGNSFSISSKGVGDALLNSASSLAAANNTLDESIALVVAANETVQDASKVGNALRTISMRIRGAKTELEEAGEITEGMAESTAALRDEMIALAGVDIMINADTFKSTYQIIDELSVKWKDLTDIQQASITELMAGKHRGDVFASLVNNFETARQVVETSANSMGSAWAENEKYLESIEGRISKLTAQFQELSSVTINDDWIKGIVDGGTGALSVLTSLIKNLGTIPVLLAGITAAMSIKNNTGKKVNMPSYPEAMAA